MLAAKLGSSLLSKQWSQEVDESGGKERGSCGANSMPRNKHHRVIQSSETQIQSSGQPLGSYVESLPAEPQEKPYVAPGKSIPLSVFFSTAFFPL